MAAERRELGEEYGGRSGGVGIGGIVVPLNARPLAA
jgi:hypothetical protein